MPTHKLTTDDGISYHITLSGPPASPSTILLTHALMSNSHMWDSTVRALHAAGHQTLLFDHIGHNATPPPSDPTKSYSTDDIARHMHAIASRFAPAGRLKAVVGCSIGGVLALRYAMLYPEEVEVAVSLCAPGITSPEATKSVWSERIAQFESDVSSGDDSLCRATAARWVPGDGARDVAAREAALGHTRTCSLEGYRVLADAIRGYDYAEELGRLRGVRCVVVAGGRDTASSVEVLRGIAEGIEGAEFVVLEEAGHIPPMQRPKEFEEVLLRELR